MRRAEAIGNVDETSGTKTLRNAALVNDEKGLFNRDEEDSWKGRILEDDMWCADLEKERSMMLFRRGLVVHISFWTFPFWDRRFDMNNT